MAGQIIPRGKNIWIVRVYLGEHPQTKKRVYQNRTIHGSKKAAEAALAAMLLERGAGTPTETARKTKIKDLLEELVADYRINGKSVDWCKLVVDKHLDPFFGHVPAGKLTTEMARNYVAFRQTKEIANATVNRELSLLRRAFNLARLSTPPRVASVPYIPMLEERNVRKGFFEDEQFHALIAELPDHLKPLLAFAYYTGCRRGEILSLHWTQVDLQRGVVRLEAGTTKNDEARVLPLVPELQEILAERKRLRDLNHPQCSWVFFHDGERIRSFKTAWAGACTRAGLVNEAGEPEKLFHDLRRTGVRNLVRAGVPETVAMRISGHKTRSVFDRYNITSEADLQDAAEKLAKHLAEKRKKPSES
ncbi:MAG: site-specific integrase [Bryobacteraceae bacterium]